LANNHQNEKEHLYVPQNVLTITNTDESFVELLDINPFESGHRNEHGVCDEPKMMTVNRFSKANMKWESELSRLEKRKKFNGCNFEYDVTHDEGVAFNGMQNDTLDPSRYSGYFIDILNEIKRIADLNWSFSKAQSIL